MIAINADVQCFGCTDSLSSFKTDIKIDFECFKATGQPFQTFVVAAVVVNAVQDL